MAHDTPAPGAIGRATPRVDGVAKVTGAALYGADHELPHAAHAFLVTSAIARGRIRHIDDAAVRALPGVLQVWTHRNAATVVQPVPSVASRGPMVFSRAPLASDEIFYAGQIVALVVAETLEAARDAALRLQVAYDDAPATATFDSAGRAAPGREPRTCHTSTRKPMITSGGST